MNQLKQFDQWFSHATKAQRVHQDAVDELDMESVIIDARLQGYTFSKALQKSVQLEATPSMEPRGPSAPGIGSTSSSRRNITRHLDKNMKPKGPKSDDDKKK